MGRLEYVCATCEEHFTRRYSATRHNIAIHNNRGEIVSLLEYLVGRSSGQYQAIHPSWYRRERRNHRFGHATVADYSGDTLRPTCLQQDHCQGQYQEHYQHPHPNLNLRMSHHIQLIEYLDPYAQRTIMLYHKKPC